MMKNQLDLNALLAEKSKFSAAANAENSEQNTLVNVDLKVLKEILLWLWFMLKSKLHELQSNSLASILR